MLITSISGLSNPTVRREFCKTKPADVDAALQAAVETHSFLEIDGLRKQFSGVNNISTETLLNIFAELVRRLRTEIQDAVAQSSRTYRNASQNNQIDRSDSRNSNRYQCPLMGPIPYNTFSKFRQPNQPNEWNTDRNSNNQRNIPKMRFSDRSSNNKRDLSSSSQRSDGEKCKHWGQSNHCNRINHCNHSIVTKWPNQEPMPCPPPKFKLKASAYQQANWTGNSKSLLQTECLNSVVDDKNIFVRAKFCDFLLDAVCDTGAGVSCLSPKYLFILLERYSHLCNRVPIDF